jgi:putative metalloenzyme radical SAM/SPASM domain maturase
MLHRNRNAHKQKRPGLGTAPLPSKLFVEPTTRCNLRCSMCVKQSQEHAIAEGDLSPEIFEALLPALPRLDALVLTGIGEPLLHPGLEDLIARARSAMPGHGEIGIQSNGRILTLERARSLLRSGLSRICLSLDAAVPETFRSLRPGAEVDDVETALANASRARAQTGRALDIGAELVLQRGNLAELPRVVQSAARLGADFLLVTQMLPYSGEMAEMAVYSGDTDASRSFYLRWMQRAREEGVDPGRYFRVPWTYRLSQRDRAAAEFVRRMSAEASSLGIPLNLPGLLRGNPPGLEQARRIFREARSAAMDSGIRLSLPALRPRYERHCPFTEEEAAFVTWMGTVHPCHFLWHECVCYPFGRRKRIEPWCFGDLSRSGIMEIWRDPAFETFRSKVLEYDYPFCTSCNIGPCNLIQGDSFEHDCHAVDVPCGDCPWCLGLLQCLR